MDFLEVFFPVSGVKTYIFIPPLVAMVISFFTSMGGVSGAFLLLPFQMSILNYTTPSVSATNFVFNIVAIPSGVYRYIKEGRMTWPLMWTIIVGTLPGVFIGYYIRVLYLPEPKAFKVFAGLVLLYIGIKLFYETKKPKSPSEGRLSMERPENMIVKTVSSNLLRVEYEFRGERFGFSVISVLLLAFVVGIVGGTYGIGGGAIIAPFCVAVFRLPVYTVAGAALAGTFITSIAGVTFYSVIPSGFNTSPDWLLGMLFGAGGFVGMYLGARVQKFVPQKAIKLMLSLVILFVAIKYIVQYF